MSIFKSSGKHREDLTFDEKVIADAALSSLGIGASDNVLEIHGRISLFENGVFDKYGCYVKSVLCADELDGGLFEYIILFNQYEKLYSALSSIRGHLCGETRVIILNTLKPLTAEELKKAAEYGSPANSPVIADGFSLLILNQ